MGGVPLFARVRHRGAARNYPVPPFLSLRLSPPFFSFSRLAVKTSNLPFGTFCGFAQVANLSGRWRASGHIGNKLPTTELVAIWCCGRAGTLH